MKLGALYAFGDIFNRLVNHVADAVSLSVRVGSDNDVLAFAIVKNFVHSMLALLFHLKYRLIAGIIGHYLLCKLFKMSFGSINLCAGYMLYLIALVWAFDDDYGIAHFSLLS